MSKHVEMRKTFMQDLSDEDVTVPFKPIIRILYSDAGVGPTNIYKTLLEDSYSCQHVT